MADRSSSIRAVVVALAVHLIHHLATFAMTSSQ
jgi:hypothetical protein